MKSQLGTGNFLDIPSGGYAMGTSAYAFGKSRPLSLDKEIEMMRSIYDYPPKSKERYIRMTQYLKLFCNSFCSVSYDPDKDTSPKVVWSDIEGNMEWFAPLLKKMATATKEQVEDPYRDENNVAFNKFFDNFTQHTPNM